LGGGLRGGVGVGAIGSVGASTVNQVEKMDAVLLGSLCG
jgi:hypothetical protein